MLVRSIAYDGTLYSRDEKIGAVGGFVGRAALDCPSSIADDRHGDKCEVFIRLQHKRAINSDDFSAE